MPATLDPAGAVTVCPPEAFVGREALIEEARAILDADASDRDNAVGVLLHGPPGIGASSAAARIAEALEEHTPVVVVGALSEAALLRALAEADRRRPDLLAPGSEPGTLRERLERLLGGPLARAPLLFVFDEFDANLSAESRPVEEAATILNDLADTIRTTESGSSPATRRSAPSPPEPWSRWLCPAWKTRPWPPSSRRSRTSAPSRTGRRRCARRRSPSPKAIRASWNCWRPRSRPRPAS